MDTLPIVDALNASDRIEQRGRWGEKLIVDRWIRQMNFDVEIIYGIGVGRGDGDIAISSGFLDTSRDDVARKNTRKDGRCLPSLGCNSYAKYILSEQRGEMKICLEFRNIAKILARQWRKNIFRYF